MSAGLQVALLTIAAIAPSLFGLWQIRRSQDRWSRRWERVRDRGSLGNRPIASPAISPARLPLGHVNCRWSARSPYIRCAVNPHGPCTGCRDYSPIDPDW